MNTKLYLPNLLEFLYDCVVRKGVNFLFHRLEREDFLKVRNHARAKKFIEFSSLEDKIILLSKLDIGCAVVFWDKEKEFKKTAQEVAMAYVSMEGPALSKQIIKDQVYATVDIDFIRSLQTMSKAGSSSVYSINRKFYHLRNFNPQFNSRKLSQKLEAERNLDWYAKTLLFAYELEPSLEAFKINMAQFRLLLMLFVAPNGATKDYLLRQLGRGVNVLLKKMDERNMVKFQGDTISIDVYGVMILDQIFSKFP